MSLWTLVKIIAALGVIAVMGFSGMLAYHVVVRPLGGVFSQIIPPVVKTVSGQSDEDLSNMLDSADMPDIDPGEKTFQKAHELLALGKLPEAREKLTAIVNVFPTSSSAPAARRIVGEMNLDEILCSSHMEGKKLHVVKRGDSLLAIAVKYNTTIDCIIHLNSMLELRGIQPGDEIVVMPLELRLLVEPRLKTLSLWEGGRFIREYNIIHLGAVPTTPQRSQISSRSAELDGKKVAPQSKTYPSAVKVIQIAKPSLQIRSWDGTGDKPPGGILLQPEDMEEISLLTRVGNEVEIR
ncbi:MAG: LysM peptidoglycan-binding domain-containing protein [Verrucomicrobiota bacterium]